MSPSRRCAMSMLCVLAMLFGSGCATMSDGRGWGENATLTPGWKRVREAAVDAAKDPNVWVPLAGAAVFQAGDLDKSVSDWARRETPVFGSAENAADWSDDLRSASSLAYALSVVLTPSGDEADEWFTNKAKGLTVGLAARAATAATTEGLKVGAGRERPSGFDDKSFPSGHTSASAVNTRLASRNLRAIPMSKGVRRTINVGLVTLTAGTAWARVEAGAHYPSDVLFGMALGNFFGAFINDAFLGLDPDAPSQVTLVPQPGGAEMRWHMVF